MRQRVAAWFMLFLYYIDNKRLYKKMLDWYKVYYALLYLPLKLLIKSKIIPADPCSEIRLNAEQPIMYVLPYNSKTDLLTLHIQCLKQRLPDPLTSLHINGISLPRYVFIYDKPGLPQWSTKKSQLVSMFHNYLNLHHLNPTLDVQLVPVSIMFGRSPGRESQYNKSRSQSRLLNGIKKILIILWLGRDSFIRFSQPLSLHYMATEHGSDKFISEKLARVARIKFIRQRLAAAGPPLPVRQDLFNKLLTSTTIEKAIQDEVRSKKISAKQAQQKAIKIIDEIAADFSYEAIRLSDRVLSWTWNRLYQGLHVHNIDRVRKLAEGGHEIVYVPCHRSHMDYLLLSYVLYHEGLAPPHIAAGINLNFWPAGPIFRRLGAFFIHRSFKGNKLYSTIFREYLSELFTHGYSVEYFIEGGRSRTGRLLVPKTGMLTITIQSMLRGSNRPITLVPIYVGYEHVMEVATYTKELRGATKKKEGLLQMLGGLRKLHNLGQSYINFGDPLPLSTWLSQQVPQWRDFIDPTRYQRPGWLSQAVDNIAAILMERINNAAAVNAINLCASILLASHQHSLTRQQLLSYLTCYLELLRNAPYAPGITIPNLTPQALLEHALAMNKFTVKHDTIGDIICLSQYQAIIIAYYRNNIQHLLILPSLVASIICGYPGINRSQIHEKVMFFYPLLKAELFLRYNKQQLPLVIDSFIGELVRQGMLDVQKTRLYPTKTQLHALQLLAANVKETLQRYAITFSLLLDKPKLNQNTMWKNNRIIAQWLSVLHGIDTPEFFDKTIFSTLVAALRSAQYISDTDNDINEKISEMCDILGALIAPNVLDTIKRASLLTNRLAITVATSCTLA